MKKILLFLFLFFTLISLSKAQNIYFNDWGLKTALLNNGVDLNFDGEISYEEVNVVDSLDISGYWIFNVQELEYFFNLQYLNCSNNSISSLPFLPSLRKLNCSGNYLQSLDLNSCFNLQVLDCSFNPLRVLKIDNLTLSELYCGNSSLTALYIGNAFNLKNLDISYNLKLRKVCSFPFSDLRSRISVNDFGSPYVSYETGCCPLYVDIVSRNVTCHNSNDGYIEIISLDNSNYLYSLNGGAYQSNRKFSNLIPGEYTIGIQLSGCTQTFNVLIEEPYSPKLDLGNDTTICSYDNLIIDAKNGFLSYLWSNGATSPTITVNQSGTYRVTVSDGWGCLQTDDITVNFVECKNVIPGTVGCGNYKNAMSIGSSSVESDPKIALGSNAVFVMAKMTSNSIVYSGNTSKACQGGFISKFNSLGKNEWIESIGNSGELGAIAVDNQSNLYAALSANSISTTIAGTTITTNTNDISSLVFAKLNSNGEVQWIKQSKNGGSGINIKKIIFDKDGNMYLLGNHYFSGFTFDNQLTINAQNGKGGVFLIKLDPDGKALWGANIENVFQYLKADISIDEVGNIYVARTARKGTVYISARQKHTVSTSSQGEYNAFISKFDSNGNYLYSKSYGGLRDDANIRIAVDKNSDFYVTSTFSIPEMDIDGIKITSKEINSNSPNNDIFYAKFNQEGHAIWAKSLSSNSLDWCQELIVRDDNSIYLSGRAGVGFHYGDIELPSINGDFIINTNTDGRIVWIDNIPNSSPTYYSFGIGNDNLIYRVGTFSNQINFGDKTLNSKGDKDVFLSVFEEKDLSQNAKYVFEFCRFDSIRLDAGVQSSYFWSVSGNSRFYTTNESDTILLQVIDNNGCLSSVDSIITKFLPQPEFFMPKDTMVHCGIDSVLISIEEGFSGYLWTDKTTLSYKSIKSNEMVGVQVLGNNGCWSDVKHINVTFARPVTKELNLSICNGEGILINNRYIHSAGTYIDTLVNSLGCDSIIVTHLSVNPTYTEEFSASICEGGVFTWEGTDYTSAGDYTKILRSTFGCDSTVTLHLSVNPTSTEELFASICEGSTFSWDGTDYTTTGNYTRVLHSVFGCDSTVTLHLTVNPVYTGEFSASICEGGVFIWEGTDYTSAGDYTKILRSTFDCDSIITLHLTVNLLPKISITQIPGNGYVSLDAGAGYSSYFWTPEILYTQTIIVTQDGTYSVLVTNQLGCEASASTNVTITGVERPHQQSVKVYPNPVKDKLTIEFSTIGYVEIINILGDVVLQKKLEGNDTINMINLLPGIYLVKISRQDILEPVILRIVKQ